MSTSRDEAMAALRAWSQPGRRADLIAAAWRSGETRVSALAEAARVARGTVYADLRARAIDPDTERDKETAVFAPLEIEGLTGELEDDATIRRLLTGAATDEEADKGGFELMKTRHATFPREEMERLYLLHWLLEHYNKLGRALAAEDTARHERDRMLHLAETRWEALSTAANWAAAHHAYVIAVDDARTAIDRWEAAATKAAEAEAKAGFTAKDGTPREEGYGPLYAKYVLNAGRSPLPVLGLDADGVTARAAELRETLERTHERRRALAAETLGPLQGAGSAGEGR